MVFSEKEKELYFKLTNVLIRGIDKNSTVKELSKMNYCHRCDGQKQELVKCKKCGQDTCFDCLEERTQFNSIDDNYCKTCCED